MLSIKSTIRLSPSGFCRQNLKLLRRLQSYHRTQSSKSTSKSSSSVGSTSSNSSITDESEGASKSKRGPLDRDELVDNVVSSSTLTIMKSLPPDAQLYAQLARFDKPIGTMLLLWPCMWSTALASGSSIITESAAVTSLSSASTSFASLSSVAGDPKLLMLFATGSFLMRGAGCTINDMWDAKYDKKVARTATRPLASGALSYKQATAFLGLQLTGGLGVLLSFPQEHLQYCFLLGAASLPLVGVYPLMKRYTNWPQLVLGMTFNWGALMGWAATHGSLDAYDGLSVVLPLYGGGIAWTMVYDTLYAHQDKQDDTKLGLKSTALYFAENTKPILVGFSALATGSWIAAGYNVGYMEPYYYLGCGAAGAHLLWQVATADLENPKNLAERFKSNATVGAIMFASCIAGNIGELS